MDQNVKELLQATTKLVKVLTVATKIMIDEYREEKGTNA